LIKIVTDLDNYEDDAL